MYVHLRQVYWIKIATIFPTTHHSFDLKHETALLYSITLILVYLFYLEDG